jgi:hypothetical protein
LAHLEERLMLVRCVDQQRIAGAPAAKHVDVVLNRADHHAVELACGVFPDPHEFGHDPRIPQ